MDQSKRLARNITRFWSKVDCRGPDECWVWLNATDGCGYGVFWANGRNNQAHRFSKEMRLGRQLKASRQLTGKDELVLHTCDNPACVNPKHLYIGTQARNIRDRDERGRTSVGASRPASKLSPRRVRKIRRLRRKGMTLTRLADKFHLHVSTVWAIVKRKAWKHVA